ncbi:MAG TPA: hypothetical protein VHG35_14105 [Gemmatimonadales bacterium]|nr:hypothetical protein [Gemmatimonadales bacterium]
MGGSYKQCGDCGKRALSIATRCPGCGAEFLAPAGPQGNPPLELGGFLSSKVVAGVLAASALLATARLGGTSRLPDERSSIVADSIAVSSEVAYATTATSRPDTAEAVAPAERSAGELLVARTWTNVRKARRTGADLEAILMPGDTVLADSLGQGWYRVALEGEVLGYAHQSTLEAPGRVRSSPRVKAEALRRGS